MKLLYEHTEAEHNIPSVEVNVLADGIAIRFPNSPTTGFSFDAASKIANTIREYLNGEHLGEKNAHLTDPDSHASSFAVWRRGNSIKVAVPMNAPEKNFTHDLAEEFADLLDKAVTRSKVAH
ncbi:hypothetical protein A8B76_08370 [Roseovarius indicus]|nr:hypothetical protein A8B76_08370 [Roseovarius indicus]